MRCSRRACALGLLLAGTLTAVGAAAQPVPEARALETKFVQVPGRVDVAYDVQRHVLYVSAGEYLQRYDIATGAMLTPLHLGGLPYGLDISADGKTLAAANLAHDATGNFVDLVDLETQSGQRRNFAIDPYEGGTYTVAFDNQGKLLVSSTFNGSGWVPLRKLDPATGAVGDRRRQARQAGGSAYILRGFRL
jgi:DNA-binding beta-propeller fold protein YncE